MHRMLGNVLITHTTFLCDFLLHERKTEGEKLMPNPKIDLTKSKRVLISKYSV